MNKSIYLQNSFFNRKSVIVYNNTTFIVETELDEHTCSDGKKYKYTLYKEGFKMCYCYVANEVLSPETKSIYYSVGFKYLPNHAIIIENINSIIKQKDNLKNKVIKVDNGKNGYASILLNYILGDVIEYINYTNKNIPIILERTNSPATIQFYQKFNATENCNGNNHIAYMPMIIEFPKQIDIYTATVVSNNFNYQNLNKELQ